jgi:hypothetical protein
MGHYLTKFLELVDDIHNDSLEWVNIADDEDSTRVQTLKDGLLSYHYIAAVLKHPKLDHHKADFGDMSAFQQYVSTTVCHNCFGTFAWSYAMVHTSLMS